MNDKEDLDTVVRNSNGSEDSEVDKYISEMRVKRLETKKAKKAKGVDGAEKEKDIVEKGIIRRRMTIARDAKNPEKDREKLVSDVLKSYEVLDFGRRKTTFDKKRIARNSLQVNYDLDESIEKYYSYAGPLDGHSESGEEVEVEGDDDEDDNDRIADLLLMRSNEAALEKYSDDADLLSPATADPTIRHSNIPDIPNMGISQEYPSNYSQIDDLFDKIEMNPRPSSSESAEYIHIDAYSKDESDPDSESNDSDSDNNDSYGATSASKKHSIVSSSDVSSAASASMSGGKFSNNIDGIFGLRDSALDTNDVGLELNRSNTWKRESKILIQKRAEFGPALPAMDETDEEDIGFDDSDNVDGGLVNRSSTPKQSPLATDAPAENPANVTHMESATVHSDLGSIPSPSPSTPATSTISSGNFYNHSEKADDSDNSSIDYDSIISSHRSLAVTNVVTGNEQEKVDYPTENINSSGVQTKDSSGEDNNANHLQANHSTLRRSHRLISKKNPKFGSSRGQSLHKRPSASSSTHTAKSGIDPPRSKGNKVAEEKEGYIDSRLGEMVPASYWETQGDNHNTSSDQDKKQPSAVIDSADTINDISKHPTHPPNPPPYPHPQHSLARQGFDNKLERANSDSQSKPSSNVHLALGSLAAEAVEERRRRADEESAKRLSTGRPLPLPPNGINRKPPPIPDRIARTMSSEAHASRTTRPPPPPLPSKARPKIPRMLADDNLSTIAAVNAAMERPSSKAMFSSSDRNYPPPLSSSASVSSLSSFDSSANVAGGNSQPSFHHSVTMGSANKFADKKGTAGDAIYSSAKSGIEQQQQQGPYNYDSDGNSISASGAPKKGNLTLEDWLKETDDTLPLNNPVDKPYPIPPTSGSSKPITYNSYTYKPASTVSSRNNTGLSVAATAMDVAAYSPAHATYLLSSSHHSSSFVSRKSKKKGKIVRKVTALPPGQAFPQLSINSIHTAASEPPHEVSAATTTSTSASQSPFLAPSSPGLSLKSHPSLSSLKISSSPKTTKSQTSSTVELPLSSSDNAPSVSDRNSAINIGSSTNSPSTAGKPIPQNPAVPLNTTTAIPKEQNMHAVSDNLKNLGGEAEPLSHPVGYGNGETINNSSGNGLGIGGGYSSTVYSAMPMPAQALAYQQQQQQQYTSQAAYPGGSNGPQVFDISMQATAPPIDFSNFQLMEGTADVTSQSVVSAPASTMSQVVEPTAPSLSPLDDVPNAQYSFPMPMHADQAQYYMPDGTPYSKNTQPSAPPPSSFEMPMPQFSYSTNFGYPAPLTAPQVGTPHPVSQCSSVTTETQDTYPSNNSINSQIAGIVVSPQPTSLPKMPTDEGDSASGASSYNKRNDLKYSATLVPTATSTGPRVPPNPATDRYGYDDATSPIPASSSPAASVVVNISDKVKANQSLNERQKAGENYRVTGNDNNGSLSLQSPGGLYSNDAHPHSQSSKSPPPYLSAKEEKEQQRLHYEYLQLGPKRGGSRVPPRANSFNSIKTKGKKADTVSHSTVGHATNPLPSAPLVKSLSANDASAKKDNENLCKEVTESEIKRREALFELAKTEREYTANLRLIVELFLLPVQFLGNRKVVDVLFGDLVKVTEINNKMYLELEKRLGPLYAFVNPDKAARKRKKNTAAIKPSSASTSSSVTRSPLHGSSLQSPTLTVSATSSVSRSRRLSNSSPKKGKGRPSYSVDDAADAMDSISINRSPSLRQDDAASISSNSDACSIDANHSNNNSGSANEQNGAPVRQDSSSSAHRHVATRGPRAAVRGSSAPSSTRNSLRHGSARSMQTVAEEDEDNARKWPSEKVAAYVRDLCVGDIMVNFIKDIPELYAQYSANHTNALAYLRHIRESGSRTSNIKSNSAREHQKLLQTIEEAERDPRMNRLDLESHLVKPIQRIMRYPMLLDAVLKYTPIDHPDHDDIALALSLAVSVAARVNRRSGELTNKRALSELQTTFNWSHLLGGVNLVLDTFTKLVGERRFIHKGALRKATSGKHLYAILFNDFMIITTSERHGDQYTYSSYRMPIQTYDLVARPPVKDTFEIVNLKLGEVIQLRADSPEEAKEWVDHITKAADHCYGNVCEAIKAGIQISNVKSVISPEVRQKIVEGKKPTMVNRRG